MDFLRVPLVPWDFPGPWDPLSSPSPSRCPRAPKLLSLGRGRSGRALLDPPGILGSLWVIPGIGLCLLSGSGSQRSLWCLCGLGPWKPQELPVGPRLRPGFGNALGTGLAWMGPDGRLEQPFHGEGGRDQIGPAVFEGLGAAGSSRFGPRLAAGRRKEATALGWHLPSAGQPLPGLGPAPPHPFPGIKGPREQPGHGTAAPAWTQQLPLQLQLLGRQHRTPPKLQPWVRDPRSLPPQLRARSPGPGTAGHRWLCPLGTRGEVGPSFGLGAAGPEVLLGLGELLWG